MYRRFLNARSPLRLLEKGLHGGLGPGNLGVVLAGPGVGKTPFLVGVGLDELLRGGHVLHVALDSTVGHVRDCYDTVFEELASSTHLDNEVATHAEIDRRRSIRVYSGGALTAGRLRDAVALESDAGGKPSLLIIEGLDLNQLPREDLADIKRVAGELSAETWLSWPVPGESVPRVPDEVARVDELVSVVLALEPDGGSVALRALKDHGNPDLSALHVSLDPRSLLLVRS